MIIDNKQVKEHFFSPKNCDVGDMTHVESVVCGSLEAGERVEMWMECQDERVNQLTYKVLGNPYLIAILSISSEALVGKTLEEVEHFDFNAYVTELQIPKNKRYCVMMVQDIVSECIKNSKAVDND